MAENQRHRLCRRLRFKGMFIEVEPDPEVPNPSDGLFWCSHTQTCLGPDRRPVDRIDCDPKRACYE